MSSLSALHSDEIFKTLVNKVLIKSPEHFVFVLENGLEYEGQTYCTSQHSTHVECCVLIERQ